MLEALDYRAETYAQIYLNSLRQRGSQETSLTSLLQKVEQCETLLDQILPQVPGESIPAHLAAIRARRERLLTPSTTKDLPSNPST
jgi:hypothetical protein